MERGTGTARGLLSRPASRASGRAWSGRLERIEPEARVVVAYLIGAILVTRAVWGAPDRLWLGSCCDPQQSIWFLEWIPYSIRHLADPFVTLQLNAPDGANLMWNSWMPLLGLVVAPLTFLAGPVVSYNVLIAAALLLSAWCARLALGRYCAGRLGPAVGGAVYGFSPYVVPQAVLHLNLATAWMPPLFLIVLDEILIRRTRSARPLGVVLGLLAAAQLLITEELLAISVGGAAVLVVIMAALRPRAILETWRRLLVALVTALGTFIVVTGLPLAVQFFGPLRIRGAVQDVETFSTDLLNPVLPTHYQLFSPDAATAIADHFSGLYHEANSYFGLPLLLLVSAVVARHWDDLRVRVAGLVAAVLFVFSLGPSLHIGGTSTGWVLPWAAFRWIPLVENILPSRIAVLVWLAIALIVAVAVDSSVSLPLRRALPRLAAVAAALVVALPAPLTTSTAQVPDFFREWDREGMRADAIVLVAPFFRDGGGADPMLWAAVAHDELRMPEAYAYVPGPDGTPSYGPPATTLSTAMETIQDTGEVITARGTERSAMASDLRAKKITDVLVGPMNRRTEMVAFFTDLFGRPPDEVDGVQLWRNVDRSGVSAPP